MRQEQVNRLFPAGLKTLKRSARFGRIYPADSLELLQLLFGFAM
jgi:hypothetical protein